ncbi:unnamed protein product, partial [marine sediment metagenome]
IKSLDSCEKKIKALLKSKLVKQYLQTNYIEKKLSMVG